MNTRQSVQDKQQIRLLSIGMFILMAVSIIAGLVFREPWLWMDEVLSYLLVSDPSLAHMNDAVVSNMDANPPLYFNLSWLVGHAISLDPLFLRIVSILLFAGTLTLFYRFTTRLLGQPVLTFVLISAIVYFTYQNFVHATGIRSYALLLPISCLYFIVVHQLVDRPASVRLLAAHTGLGLLMAFCHNFGLFYLMASGAFFTVLWFWSGQRSYALVLMTYLLMGVVWLLVWFPSFTIQALAGKPHSWIPLPTVESFFYAVGNLIPVPYGRLESHPGFAWLPIARSVLLAGLYVYLVVPRLKAGFRVLREDAAFRFFLLSGFVYLTTIFIALLISLTYTSVFISRYMWPSQLLIMFQIVYMAYHFAGARIAGPRTSRRVRQLSRLVPVYTILLGGVIFYKVWKMQMPFPSRILTYLPELNKPYPVFVERADYFLPIWFHNQRPGVSFLLNWQTANSPRTIPNSTVDFKILTSVRDKYNVPGIIDANQFTAANFPHFYVVDEQNVYQIEEYINRGQVKVVNKLPIDMPGHQLLECSF